MDGVYNGIYFTFAGEKKWIYEETRRANQEKKRISEDAVE